MADINTIIAYRELVQKFVEIINVAIYDDEIEVSDWEAPLGQTGSMMALTDALLMITPEEPQKREEAMSTVAWLLSYAINAAERQYDYAKQLREDITRFETLTGKKAWQLRDPLPGVSTPVKVGDVIAEWQDAGVNVASVKAANPPAPTLAEGL